MGRVKGREYPSVARWRASRARKQVLRKVKNKLGWWGVALPVDWDSWDEAKQLAWARRKLMELAEGSGNEKVQSMSASALARSLEPKRPATAASPTQPSTGSEPRSREYLEAIKAEAEAELEKLDGDKH